MFSNRVRDLFGPRFVLPLPPSPPPPSSPWFLSIFHVSPPQFSGIFCCISFFVSGSEEFCFEKDIRLSTRLDSNLSLFCARARASCEKTRVARRRQATADEGKGAGDGVPRLGRPSREQKQKKDDDRVVEMSLSSSSSPFERGNPSNDFPYFQPFRLKMNELREMSSSEFIMALTRRMKKRAPKEGSIDHPLSSSSVPGSDEGEGGFPVTHFGTPFLSDDPTASLPSSRQSAPPPRRGDASSLVPLPRAAPRLLSAPRRPPLTSTAFYPLISHYPANGAVTTTSGN